MKQELPHKESQPDLQQQINSLVKRVEELEGRVKVSEKIFIFLPINQFYVQNAIGFR